MALNPRKKFKFAITFPSSPEIPTFHVQSVTLPDLTIEQDEHGEGNTISKTAGMAKVGNCTVERILPAGGGGGVSAAIWEWANSAQNNLDGTGSDPSVYKRIVLVEELDHDGVLALNSWFLLGAWPTTINGREFNRTESGNRVESFELSVDRVSLDTNPGAPI